MARTPTNKMRRRMLFIMFGMALFGFVTLIGRLWYIQIIQSQRYQHLAEKQQMISTVLAPKRGSIYDKNMKVLAKSASVWTVFLAPVEIKDDTERLLIAEKLAKILNVDKDMILEKSKKKNYYEIIKRKIEKPTADEITKFAKENKINAVRLEEDNKRYYPYENFASSILGFTGIDNEGQSGIEAYYEKILKGESGRVVAAKNAKGTDMPFKYEQRYEAKDGNSLVLTIDEVLQHFVEKHLEIAVKEHGIRNRATGIIMDVKTGEILAMATKPDFDPNNPREIFDKEKLSEIDKITNEKEKEKAVYNELQSQWRNKAISDPYEPGSVFKIITASTAIETGTTKPTDSYCCNGHITVADRTIHCWKRGGHGTQDFPKAMMNSCNPWFINAGQKIGTVKFRDFFKAFGFTDYTGIDLPGEAEAIYHPMKNFKEIELASSSMGQTFKVTPIQLITGVSAAINGGELYKPHIVKQIIDSDGNIVENVLPQSKRQVISKETSKIVSEMCEGVVKQGSGRNAYIKGYRVGGKTGTSEKIDKKVDGSVRYYILSFLGFAPVDDPKIAVLLLLDEPSEVGYGSVMAAPVVGAIIGDALPYLGIDPKYTKEELEKMDMNIPYIAGQTLEQAIKRLSSMELKYDVIGEGKEVLKQFPAGGSKVPAGSVIILYTNEDELEKTLKVPSVMGLTGAQASKKLGEIGLNMRMSGANININGTIAAKQDPPEGTEVSAGTIVNVEFINLEQVE